MNLNHHYCQAFYVQILESRNLAKQDLAISCEPLLIAMPSDCRLAVMQPLTDSLSSRGFGLGGARPELLKEVTAGECVHAPGRPGACMHAPGRPGACVWCCAPLPA